MSRWTRSGLFPDVSRPLSWHASTSCCFSILFRPATEMGSPAVISARLLRGVSSRKCPLPAWILEASPDTNDYTDETCNKSRATHHSGPVMPWIPRGTRPLELPEHSRLCGSRRYANSDQLCIIGLHSPVRFRSIVIRVPRSPLWAARGAQGSPGSPSGKARRPWRPRAGVRGDYLGQVRMST